MLVLDAIRLSFSVSIAPSRVMSKAKCWDRDLVTVSVTPSAKPPFTASCAPPDILNYIGDVRAWLVGCSMTSKPTFRCGYT